MLLELLERRPLRVEQERPALLEPGRDVVLMDVFLLVAGDEVGRVDEIGGLDRGPAEAQAIITPSPIFGWRSPPSLPEPPRVTP